MSSEQYYRIYQNPELKKPVLLICWDADVGFVGNNVFKYLSNEKSFTTFAEIEPEEFFPLSGVAIDNDVAVFPESKFYQDKESNMVIFKSSYPRFEWYKFVDIIIEIARDICKIKEIYTVGGMVSITAHTIPRLLMATVNNAEMKAALCHFDINLSLDYETPQGQRPTMSSYVLWEAMRRNIMGAGIWVPVPFYMVSAGDLRACRRVIDFLNQRLKLNLNFTNLDKSLSQQNKAIMNAVDAFPEIMEIIRKLETNSTLTENESSKLVEIIEEYLKVEKYT